MTQLYSANNRQALLHEHGMKATPQRLAIADLMLTNPTHATAQQVYELLKENFPSISQNTVYLTLANFEESGLLRRFFADGRMIFDSNTSLHHHACCSQCGVISDIPEKRKPAHPNQLSDWHIHNETRTWAGFCPDCCDSNTA